MKPITQLHTMMIPSRAWMPVVTSCTTIRITIEAMKQNITQTPTINSDGKQPSFLSITAAMMLPIPGKRKLMHRKFMAVSSGR